MRKRHISRIRSIIQGRYRTLPKYPTGHGADSYRQRGTVMIWVAIFGLVLIGLVGLGIDYAKVFLVAHQLQNGVDGSALAGALNLKTSKVKAREAAVAVASDNYAENLSITVDENGDEDGYNVDTNGEVVLGRWLSSTKEFIPTDVSPNAVKVVAYREASLADSNRPPVTLHFGPLFLKNTADLVREAIAINFNSGGAGIIVLEVDPIAAEYPKFGWTNGGSGFVWNGTSGIIDLRGEDANSLEPLVGDIHINAEARETSKVALEINGTPIIYAGNVNVYGETNPSLDNDNKWQDMQPDDFPPFTVNAWPDANVGVLDDPLEDINVPDLNSMATPYDANVINDTFITAQTGTNTIQLAPGYYPGGINVNNSEVVLTGGGDGIYAFGGETGTGQKSGLVVGQNATVRDTGDPNVNDGYPAAGYGVMVYVTGDGEDVEYGEISIGGTLVLHSRGDTLFQSDPNTNWLEGESGVVLWQDRGNQNLADFKGTADPNVIGTLYLGYNPVKIAGDPNNLGNQILAGALELDGGITIEINYDGRNRGKENHVALVK